MSACLVLLAGAFSASAVPPVSATLHASVEQVAAGEPFDVAVRFQMAPGWHIYWTNPGDAGMSMIEQWSVSGGSLAGPLEWPAPEVFLEDGLVAYGFSGEVWLPARIVPGEGPDVDLQLDLEWLACRELCVPGNARLTWSAPVADVSVPSPAAPAIAAARDRLPVKDASWVFLAEEEGEHMVLRVRRAEGKLTAGSFFPSDPGVAAPLASPRAREAGNELVLRLARDPYGTGDADRLRGVWVPVTGRTVRVDAPIQAVPVE